MPQSWFTYDKLQGNWQIAHHLELHLKTHWAFLETSCPGHEGASHASHPLEGSWSFHSHDGTTDHSSHGSLHCVEEFIDVLSAKSINLLCKMSMVSQDCWMEKQDVFVKHKCPQQWPIPKMAKITRTYILIPVERSCHKKWPCAIWKF